MLEANDDDDVEYTQGIMRRDGASILVLIQSHFGLSE